MVEVHNFLWNTITLFGLLLISIYFHFYTKGIIIKDFGKALVKMSMLLMRGKKQEFQIVATSLGAVMGIGNIVGVATALISGGAGAIFWMVISSILLSSLKYVEIYLAMVFQKYKGHVYYGGAHVYLNEGLGSPILSVLYLVILLAVSLIMGNLIVSSTLTSLISDSIALSPTLIGIGLCLCTLIILWKGQAGAMSFNAAFMPYMVTLYVVICFSIIFMHSSLFVEALKQILVEAFKGRGMVGGGIGLAIKYGVSRGLFSNESGMGSCTLIHAKSHNSKHQEAMVGVIEVFLDSVVMCFLTGVILVMSGIPYSLNHASLFLKEGFSVFLGSFGGTFVFLSLVFFGFCSMIGWYVFGSECVSYISSHKWMQRGYAFLFLSFIVIGSQFELLAAFLVSDILNAVLLIMNIMACVALRKYLKRE